MIQSIMLKNIINTRILRFLICILKTFQSDKVFLQIDRKCYRMKRIGTNARSTRQQTNKFLRSSSIVYLCMR